MLAIPERAKNNNIILYMKIVGFFTVTEITLCVLHYKERNSIHLFVLLKATEKMKISQQFPLLNLVFTEMMRLSCYL